MRILSNCLKTEPVFCYDKTLYFYEIKCGSCVNSIIEYSKFEKFIEYEQWTQKKYIMHSIKIKPEKRFGIWLKR